jgi:hypothetical protein
MMKLQKSGLVVVAVVGLAGFFATKCYGLPEVKTGSSAEAKVNAFFDVGPLGSENKLPADEVFPRGRKFPFSFYSVGGGSMNKRGELLPEAEKIADQDHILAAGVTLVGPQYELNDEIVALAKRGKCKAIYTLTPVFEGQPINIKSFQEWSKAKRPVPFDDLMKSLAEQVRAVASNPEIAWWDVTPEELRWWVKNEMTYLELATKTVRENDPMKRPVMMYDPGHRGATSLAKTNRFLDFSSKGMYTNYSGHRADRAWNIWSIQQELEAKKILQRDDLVILALPEMFQQPKEEELPLVPSWVRYDVYSALVTGAQGIVVFSASKRSKFTARELYLENYLTICRELTGPLQLGQVFLFGQAMNDLTLNQSTGPKEVSVKVGKDAVFNCPTLTLGNKAWNHCRFVFVVNSSAEQASGTVEGIPLSKDVKIRPLWGESTTCPLQDGKISFTLPAWGVAGWMLYR